jgi:hypothetical protein
LEEHSLEETRVEKSIFEKLINSLKKVAELKIWELGINTKFDEGINQKTVFNVVYKEKLNSQSAEIETLKKEQKNLYAKIADNETIKKF